MFNDNYKLSVTGVLIPQNYSRLIHSLPRSFDGVSPRRRSYLSESAIAAGRRVQPSRILEDPPPMFDMHRIGSSLRPEGEMEDRIFKIDYLLRSAGPDEVDESGDEENASHVLPRKQPGEALTNLRPCG